MKDKARIKGTPKDLIPTDNDDARLASSVSRKGSKEGKPCRKTPSFILELPLRVDWSQENRLRAHLETARCLYNALLSEANKRLHKMRNDPAWQTARSIPRTKKLERAQAFSHLRRTHHFSEYDLHEYAKRARVSWIADHIESTDGSNAGNACLSSRQPRLRGQSEKGALSQPWQRDR